MVANGIVSQRITDARVALAKHALSSVEKTIFASPAGKKRVADRMAKMLPEHRVYTEPFVGSGAVLFAKPPSELEVINDIDPEIAHAFLTLKGLTADGIKTLSAMDWVGNKETYARVYASHPLSDVKKLYRFLYLSNFSFMTRRGSLFDEGRAGVVARTMKRIERFQPRLAKVVVRCGDYESTVRKYDAPDAAHFLDAPYPGYNAHVREGQFDEQRFFELLKDIRGKFLVNYGERGVLPKLAKKEGFVCRRLRTKRQFAHIRAIGGSDTLVHTIISNYAPVTKALDDEFDIEELSLDECEKSADASHRLSVYLDGPAIDSLPQLLSNIEDAGRTGHSFGIQTDDSPAVKLGGWDGDGGGTREIALKAAPTGKAPRKVKLKGKKGRVSDFDVVDGLKKFGPPNEWSGAVASIAGPERRKAMQDLWQELSSAEQQQIEEAFQRNLETAERLLKTALRKRLAKSDSVKKTVDFQGITIHIDRPVGFVQTGTDSEGNAWSRTYQNDYGFIPNTEGGDAECLDVFLGPEPDAETAYWCEQHKADGTFDEYKLMLGFSSQDEAVATYKAHIPEKYLGTVLEMPLCLIQSLVGVEPSVVTKADTFHATSRIIKGINPADERFVLGIVLEPEVVDAQGDIYSAEEIRQAAHRFMEDFRGLGLQHKTRVNDKVKILESYVAPSELVIHETVIRAGTWLLAVRVLDDALWDEVKSGDFTGFSIGGTARRYPEPNADAASREQAAA